MSHGPFWLILSRLLPTHGESWVFQAVFTNKSLAEAKSSSLYDCDEDFGPSLGRVVALRCVAIPIAAC